MYHPDVMQGTVVTPEIRQERPGKAGCYNDIQARTA